MNSPDVNKNSGFSSTNMNLSEPARFLIFIVKDIPRVILKAPFVLLFSFERFYLWDVAKVLHFIAQLSALIIILKASNNETVAMIGFNIFGIESPPVFWIVTFIMIRVMFELLLVLLGIHKKLSIIADTIEGMKKETILKNK